jgi:lipopolysaccharide transport system ATP-binding protein
VLAVGDEEFQKKCLGKMKDSSENEGRTILIVSHNLAIVNKLCNSSFLFSNGLINKKGKSQELIEWYLKSNLTIKETSVRNRKLSSDINHFIDIYNCNSELEEQNIFSIQQGVNYYVYFNAVEFVKFLELAVSVYDVNKNRVFTIHEKLINFDFENNKLGVQIIIPPNFLTPGKYSWILCLHQPGVKVYDLHDDICEFTIVETGSAFSMYQGGYGSVFPIYNLKQVK